MKKNAACFRSIFKYLKKKKSEARLKHVSSASSETETLLSGVQHTRSLRT